MKLSTRILIAATGLFGLPAMAWSQATQVTFRIPINLSHLVPETVQVRARCSIGGPAIPGFYDPPPKLASMYEAFSAPIAVVNGRVSTTVDVVVNVPRLNEPAGKTAEYYCGLQGGYRGNDPNYVYFRAFSPDNGNVALKLTVPGITGVFPWVDPAPTATAPPNVSTTSPGGNP